MLGTSIFGLLCNLIMGKILHSNPAGGEEHGHSHTHKHGHSAKVKQKHMDHTHELIENTEKKVETEIHEEENHKKKKKS